ncbi:TetR/AcrR family transcriptional regulator [Kallotenue papyrolyticum]|uniref:TetR/AcrR family transcriptional regulator n=1 Tax=Kallotenue papyrolyticum TaxID=1325125 RepID=UPI000492D07E|nr:TetR/AcrR family transcriptional regulator [Kallotenue papyrolyticum]
MDEPLTRSRARLEKSQLRAERILEAALEVFAQKGYRDAAIDDIAIASQTSKGGVYFHFPNKQAIFLRLLDQMAHLLLSRAEQAMAAEPDPLRKGDAALLTMLRTFAGHRRLTRLFLVEALGAGREFNLKMQEIHAAFAGLISRYLDELVAAGLIAPLDTQIAGMAWFGGINEVVRRWVLTGQPEHLEDAYPALRDLLRRSIGQPTDHA